MVLLGKLALLTSYCSQPSVICPEETVTSDIGSFTWDEVNNPGDQLYVSHQYHCLDKYKHYVTRKCEDSGWVPTLDDIQCDYSIEENDILTTCAPSYKTIKDELKNIRICFKLSSEEQTWTNTCLESGSQLTFNQLNEDDRELLNMQLDDDITITTTDLWLPAS